MERVDAEVSERVERERRGILLETFEPDSLYEQLAGIVLDEGFEIDLMTSPDDNVQAVFDYLTHGRTEEVD